MDFQFLGQRIPNGSGGSHLVEVATPIRSQGLELREKVGRHFDLVLEHLRPCAGNETPRAVRRVSFQTTTHLTTPGTGTISVTYVVITESINVVRHAGRTALSTFPTNAFDTLTPTPMNCAPASVMFL